MIPKIVKKTRKKRLWMMRIHLINYLKWRKLTKKRRRKMKLTVLNNLMKMNNLLKTKNLMKMMRKKNMMRKKRKN